MLVEKSVRFIQWRIPKLKAGAYSIAATLTAGPKGAPVTYPQATRGFAVAAPRFRIAGDQLASVFPPNLANGEFSGCLPHAVLAKPALPWMRTAYSEDDKALEKPSTPWLAVLTLQADEIPAIGQGSAVATMPVAALVPDGSLISVRGAAPLDPPVYGTLPGDVVSYPGLATLDYGESPQDPVNVIELSVALFTRIAPTLADLDLLAHLRETDTYDTVDSKDAFDTRSVVLGNRCGAGARPALALLVSLEQLSDCLPDDAGEPGPGLAGAASIRLAVFASWTFTSDTGGEDLAALLRGLNADGLQTPRMPAAAVGQAQVDTALAEEAVGLAPPAATTLATNALNAGYVPLSHHLRQAGRTVSWLRGPLLPYGSVPPLPVSSVAWPDALLRYDPQTGMFDASYAAAWQLGQLMALQSRAYSTALYVWKRQVRRTQAILQEQARLDGLLLPEVPRDGTPPMHGAFGKLFARRRTAATPELPQVVTDFVGSLLRLEDVPFNYLVPDEGMLPPESLRIFTLDTAWTAALVDGAFSIGRTDARQVAADAETLPQLLGAGAAAARRRRRNDRPHLAQSKQRAGASPLSVTGLLLRSQAVRGWPRLQIDGYSTFDDGGEPDVAQLRSVHLSADVLLCLFDGPVAMVALHEPPEQLHSGVEFQAGPGEQTATTTLRALNGPTPGLQYPEGAPPETGTAAVPLRADGLTIRSTAAAVSIRDALNTQFGADVGPLTADTFAIEMVKGVLRVEFSFGAASHA